MIGAEGGEVKIVVAVVVVVADRTSETIGFDRQTRLLGHLGESAVMVVVVKRRKRFGSRGMPRPVHGIEEEKILPPVIVIVDKTNPAAHRFGEIFLTECAGIVL